MHRKRRWVAISISLLFLIVRAPVMAQTDINRIQQVEAQVNAMAQELAGLRSQPENAKQTGSIDDQRGVGNAVLASEGWQSGGPA